MSESSQRISLIFEIASVLLWLHSHDSDQGAWTQSFITFNHNLVTLPQLADNLNQPPVRHANLHVDRGEL